MPFFDLSPYIPFDLFAFLALMVPLAIAARAADRASKDK